MAEIPGTHEPGFAPAPLVRDEEGTRMIALVLPTGVLSVEVWRMGECAVIVAREAAGAAGEPLWHLSISRRDQHPSWDEIKTARYRLLPRDLCFGMLLPPPEVYVNVPQQDHVFHLWEITDPREPWTGM